jgi:anti-sigma B factor antagonist
MTTVSVYQAIHEQDGSLLIELRGEIDLANAPDVEVLLITSLDAGESRIVIDLAGVTFMGSSALRALAVGHHAAEACAGTIVLRSPPKRVMELFRITGLDAVFHIEAEGGAGPT